MLGQQLQPAADGPQCLQVYRNRFSTDFNNAPLFLHYDKLNFLFFSQSLPPSIPPSILPSLPPSFPQLRLPSLPPHFSNTIRVCVHFTGCSAPLPRCGFLGVACESWEAYLNGSCWGCAQEQEKRERCLTMGFSATPLALSPQPGTPRPGTPQPAVKEKSDSSSNMRTPNSTQGESRANDSASEARVPHATEVPATVPEFPVKVFLGTGSQKPFCGESFWCLVKGERGEMLHQEA